MSSQSFKALQPFEPRLYSLPYAAALLPCFDVTDLSDASDTDCTGTDCSDVTDDLEI